MTLSWNEIKDRALQFSQEWAEASNEDADAKPFLVEFFNVFGITSRRVASFEHRVKKLDDSDGYIDLLWKGNNPCGFSALYGFIKVLCALQGAFRVQIHGKPRRNFSFQLVCCTEITIFLS